MKDITQITVTSVGFDSSMNAYPLRIECNGTVHQFVGRGSFVAVQDGSQTTMFYRARDTIREYRLRGDGNGWVLLNKL